TPPGGPPTKPPATPPAPVPVEGLEFVGQVRGQGAAKFLLLYPVIENKPPPEKGKAAPKRSWVEVPVTLDFATPKPVAVPDAAKKRKPDLPPGRDDLEGFWAVAQAGQFAALE